MAEKYQGKVFIHYYRQDQKSIGVIRWDEEGYVVQSDRTKMIDAVVSEFHSTDILFNMTQKSLEEYIHHWENMYRVLKENTQGITQPKWETIEGRPDHFAHATVLWRIALEQTLSEGDIVEPGVSNKDDGEHPFVYANHSMDSIDLDEVLERAESKGWKTKHL